jgi:hypothetical protein
MNLLSKVRSRPAWRFCVRVAVAFCLVVFGVGDAVERSLAGHVGLDVALTYVVSAEQSADGLTDHSGLHVDGQSDASDIGGDVVGHGCHGCAALPERMTQVMVVPSAPGATLAWTAVPSRAGREPLVDLPPPRA